MEWQKPSAQEVWLVIDAYVELAYEGKPTSTVRTRLQALRSTDDGTFYQSATLERDDPDDPQKFALRLGNRFYPHMKLIIEPTPDRTSYMFRADTHDKHVRPAPNSREYSMFCQLMEDNQKLAEAIEAAWERQGLPTFKQYLRRDLARRAGGAGGEAGGAGGAGGM